MEWRKIEFEKGYSLSEYGTIRHDESGKLLSSWKTNRGYIQVEIKHRKYSQHRLVGMVYHKDKMFDGAIIHHLDNDITNNHYKNLKWTTQSYNIKAAYDQGRHSKKNDRHHLTKFTKDDVKKIRMLIETGKKGVVELANELGVCHQTISNIKNYKVWICD